jgi:peptidoglycan/LPS O-acetylase OafA/YrhL
MSDQAPEAAMAGELVDMAAHNGLRGVLACWVMLFHCVLYSDYPLDLQGSSLMPFFFLLSGFTLAVVYGAKTGDDGQFTDKKSYFQNRFARAFPVYYVCTALAVPLWLYGYGSADPDDTAALAASLATSVVPVNTFFIFLLGGPIDGPGWTICTLAVMWWLLPYTYRSIRSCSDAELTTNITNCYWLQMALVLVIFPIFILFLGFWPAFAAATMQPLVRYPLFLMGAFAGELCRRRRGQPLLWPSSGLLFFPSCCCCKVEYEAALLTEETASHHWSKRSFNSSALFVATTLAVALVDAVARYGVGGDRDSGSILGGWWYQAIVPFIQLEIIVALTRERSTESVTQRILLHPVAQWLGKISLSIYLVHWVLIYYLCWLLEGGRLRWPAEYECDVGPGHDECVATIEDFKDARTIPVWGIFAVLAASLLCAWALHRLVEQPGRRLLGTGTSSRYREEVGQYNYITEMPNRARGGRVINNNSRSDAGVRTEQKSTFESGIPIFA